MTKDLNTCMCKHMCMATKTITIMDDAYLLLLRNKVRNESFSQMIRRHFGKKRSIMQFAGAWNDMNDNEIDELKDKIKSIREGMNKSILKKVKNYDLS